MAVLCCWCMWEQSSSLCAWAWCDHCWCWLKMRYLSLTTGRELWLTLVFLLTWAWLTCPRICGAKTDETGEETNCSHPECELHWANLLSVSLWLQSVHAEATLLYARWIWENLCIRVRRLLCGSLYSHYGLWKEKFARLYCNKHFEPDPFWFAANFLDAKHLFWYVCQLYVRHKQLKVIFFKYRERYSILIKNILII